jgi:acetyl esterase/lipase
MDAWGNLRWIAANADSLGADLQAGFIVGGGSAGATLAAAVVQMAKSEKLVPPITGQLLSIPALLDKAIVPEKYHDVWISRKQNADAPGINRQALDEIMADWEPDVRSTWFSPINSVNAGSGLPSTYLQVCGMDSLRDDGLVWEQVLRDQGVSTGLDVYPGMPHGF